MTEAQRIAFLHDLRAVMSKHGVDKMEVHQHFNDCSCYDENGDGLCQFRSIKSGGEDDEIEKFDF